MNVASVPQRSPFRYPGGKTWFIPELRRWLAQRPRPHLLVEPFAGGAIVGITAVAENLVNNALLVEKDPMVAAVWRTILGGDAEWLAQRILSFDLSIENCQAVLAKSEVEPREEGFRTILRNRINHGGILAAGSGMLKHGEGGKGIASRWYPETLAKRIRAIDAIRHRLTFVEGDGMDVMDAHKTESTTAFFIDPPYTAGTKGKRAGNRLYVHFQLDHERLFDLAAEVAGDFLMTYDDDAEVLAMATSRGLRVCKVPMKGTHHRETLELVIMPSWSQFS
ncbi:MAG: DNA methyltransferase [Betaproteobacteria bacterium HGW-Betaproteobacteria-18]|nr:MAG: DNA methyltransferase [Betaproteobacteria bacterium HGW-Betaproteobacteria-18]